MSRSVITCKACKQPLAYRHHSGRIPVEAGVKAVLLPSGRMLLTCKCGEQRVIQPDNARAA